MASLAAPARAAEIWLTPPDNIMQRNEDFPQLFEHPQSWATARARIRVMEVTGNWLRQAPAPLVARALGVLRAAGIGLAVSIPAMPADKHVCGDGIEGMIWPGEGLAYARDLRARGVDVYAFTLDLPLGSGHVSQAPHACRLSIPQAAARLAAIVGALRSAYPQAKIIDEEVPTGMPVAMWARTLAAWLAAYRAASGRDFDGLTMDVAWASPWAQTTLRTAAMLRARGIAAGIFLDADGGTGVAHWIEQARRHACAIQALHLPVDYVVFANWTLMDVRTLPDSDPHSLSGLVAWYAAHPACGQ